MTLLSNLHTQLHHSYIAHISFRDSFYTDARRRHLDKDQKCDKEILQISKSKPKKISILCTFKNIMHIFEIENTREGANLFYGHFLTVSVCYLFYSWRYLFLWRSVVAKRQ